MANVNTYRSEKITNEVKNQSIWMEAWPHLNLPEIDIFTSDLDGVCSVSLELDQVRQLIKDLQKVEGILEKIEKGSCI